jgi:hypothetical protein
MSHFTYDLNAILDNNYLFQEKEEPLFSTNYLNLNSPIPTLSSNSYSFVYHKLTAYVYAKYKEKYDYSRQKRHSFYVK